MTLPVRLTFHGFQPSEAVEARIRQRAEKLFRRHARITECRVVVEAPHRHHRHGKLYQLRIDLVVPGGELVINSAAHDKHAHEDVYVAIRDAFDAMDRKLEQFVSRRKNEIKAHEAPAHGTIVRMFPDYGFIEDSDGNEIYFHCNSVVEADYDNLQIGDPVRIVVAHGESDKGPQASTVKPIGKHHIVE